MEALLLDLFKLDLLILLQQFGLGIVRVLLHEFFEFFGATGRTPQRKSGPRLRMVNAKRARLFARTVSIVTLLSHCFVVAPIAVVISTSAKEQSHIAAELALEVDKVFTVLFAITLPALQARLVQIGNTIWTNQVLLVKVCLAHHVFTIAQAPIICPLARVALVKGTLEQGKL